MGESKHYENTIIVTIVHALIYIRTVEFTVSAWNPVREGELSMNHLMMSEVSETTVPITTDMY